MLRAKYLKISWRYRLTFTYSVQTLSHLSMHLRWKICWQGSSRMRCRLTNSDIQTTHDVCVTAPPLPLDCFTASSDRWLAAADVNWNEASRSMSALDRPLGLDSLSWRARPNNAYTQTHTHVYRARSHTSEHSEESDITLLNQSSILRIRKPQPLWLFWARSKRSGSRLRPFGSLSGNYFVDTWHSGGCQTTFYFDESGCIRLLRGRLRES